MKQELDSRKTIDDRYYSNITIYKQDYLHSNIFKRVYIYFNTSDSLFFKVQNFNFSIFYHYTIIHPYQYFQMCQGSNTPKELYFYVNSGIEEKKIFTPIFGSYDSYFINEEKIKVLSDFNFNDKRKTTFFQKRNEIGYLKIECQNPAMVLYINSYFSTNNNLTSGGKYFETKDRIINHLTLEKNLVNKNIPLKFTLLEYKYNSNIELYLDDELIIINNTTPLELSYEYEKYTDDLIRFKNEEDIDDDFLLEIIVGFPKEELNSIRQINFVDSLGILSIEK